MPYNYDENNIFARILRGEIPAQTVLETDHALAFNDIQPRDPVHVLVIPKGPYVCFDHFVASADEDEIVGFFGAVRDMCRQLGIEPGANGNGYRLITNTGHDGVQEIEHFHVHVLAGRRLGPMLYPAG